MASLIVLGKDFSDNPFSLSAKFWLVVNAECCVEPQQ